MESIWSQCVCFPTLLSSQQPLDALDEFVPMAVRVDADLFQLFVTHVCQHVQRNLPQNKNLLLKVTTQTMEVNNRIQIFTRG